MIGMNGGKHQGRYLCFLDSAATTEEKKMMMIVWTITKRVETHLNQNIGVYPVTVLEHTHYGSTDVISLP